MGGMGGSDTDSSYSRDGKGTKTASHVIPAGINDLITQNAAGAAPDPTMVGKQNAEYSRVLGLIKNDIPGYGNFTTLANQSTTEYPGRTQLTTTAARDPFSSNFESATNNSYKQRAADALAQMASGPDAVRGGASQTGIASAVLAERLAKERGYEVRNAQQQDQAISSDAIKTMNQVELAKSQQGLQAASTLGGLSSQQDALKLQAAKSVDIAKLNNMGLLQLAAGLQGSTDETQEDHFYGKGNQVGSNWSTGIQCCFIFLECLNGKLPWYIDLARNDYRTGSRRTGYVWMSDWLVPLMQRHARIKRFVNFVLIKPFLGYGACLYKDKERRWTGWLAAPYCELWLGIWGTLGHFVKASH